MGFTCGAGGENEQWEMRCNTTEVDRFGRVRGTHAPLPATCLLPVGEQSKGKEEDSEVARAEQGTVTQHCKYFSRQTTAHLE